MFTCFEDKVETQESYVLLLYFAKQNKTVGRHMFQGGLNSKVSKLYSTKWTYGTI